MSYFFNELRTTAFSGPTVADISRKWKYDLSASLAGTATTLAFTHQANRTARFRDASGDVVLTSVTAAFTSGNLAYADSADTIAFLANGTSTQVLHGGAVPTWGSISLTTDVSGVLPVANGGTNSGTALTNGRVMVSVAGAIKESTSTLTINQLVVGDTTAGAVVKTLPAGSNGDVLQIQSGIPTWTSVGTITNTLSFTVLSTIFTSYLNSQQIIAYLPWRAGYNAFATNYVSVWYDVQTANAETMTISVGAYPSGTGYGSSTALSLASTGSAFATFSLGTNPGNVNAGLVFSVVQSVGTAVVNIAGMTFELSP